jgi:hypothetical protein
VCLGEEPYPGVHVPLAAQEQEERERQDGRQRGDEPGGANGYSSGGREEVPEQLSQLLPQIVELVAEPLEDPTEPVLLGEPLNVFRRSLWSLSRGGNETGKTIDLVDQHGQKDPHHKEQRHHYSQVGERYGKGALDQPVASLEPVDRRVEHRCQKECDDEPADERAYLPEQEERT